MESASRIGHSLAAGGVPLLETCQAMPASGITSLITGASANTPASLSWIMMGGKKTLKAWVSKAVQAHLLHANWFQPLPPIVAGQLRKQADSHR